MKQIYHSFLRLLATATDKLLARYLQYLKSENQLLRAKLPKRTSITPEERRRLLKFGIPVGPAIKDLITIVSPRTLGELKKLGVRTVARSTVVNILRENGLDPGPKRGEGTQTLWACDFFSKNVWTMHGLVEFFIFFVIHIGSRRVHVVGMTPHPDRAWMAQQARNLAMYFAEQPVQPTILLRDNEGKFSSEFDQILQVDGLQVHRITPLSPNLNALAERWVQSAKRETLDHFVVFGEAHLRYLLGEFQVYFNERRPHQSLGNAPPQGDRSPPVSPLPVEDVCCDERLGGVLKHYYRRAA
jgi:putative transposase